MACPVARLQYNDLRSRRAAVAFLLLAGFAVFSICAAHSCSGHNRGDDVRDFAPAPPEVAAPDTDRPSGQCGFHPPPAGIVDISVSSDIYHAGVFSRISAKLRSNPESSYHQVVMEEGGCRYLKAASSLCDTPCDYEERCTADGECSTYPKGVSGGSLTVTGLEGGGKVDLVEVGTGTYWPSGELPAPLFGAGDGVEAELSGGEFPAFTLAAQGVALMDTDYTADGFEMKDGGDAVVTWTKGPDPDACVRFVLNGPNLAHGLPLDNIIWCEGPDTGTMVVPQAMVENFPPGKTPEVTAGHDWPVSELTRYNRTTEETSVGPAELVVRSTTYFLLSHPE